MKIILASLAILFLVSSGDLRAEVILNYDCSFEIAMSSVYPPECYDPGADGIFHITDQIRSTHKSGKVVYSVVSTKRWPIVQCSNLSPTSTTHTALKLEPKNNLLKLFISNRRERFNLINLPSKLKKNIFATRRFYRSDLLQGGACASCVEKVRGSCQKVN